VNDDLEAALRAYAPPVVAPTLPEGDVSYVLHDTPVGRLVVAATDRGVVACSYAPEGAVTERLARSVSPRVLRGGSRADAARRALDGYFAGNRDALDVAVDPALLGAFQRQVLTALRASVPYGSTTSYGDLARRVGRPRAARAVGAALGANPVCLVLPCHRVVGASGALTGYAGGVDAKAELLRLEGSLPRSPGAGCRPAPSGHADRPGRTGHSRQTGADDRR
jgi:methylated-DNA-[protein]-cysteine S-methyltransferase